MNYNMQGMTKSVMELHGMLRTAEENIQKSNPMLMVQRGQIKKKGKGNGKAKPMGPKPSGRYPKFPNTPKGNQPKLKESESTCFLCNQVRHWKKNCKLLKEEKNRTKASNSGIMLLNNMSISTTLVLILVVDVLTFELQMCRYEELDSYSRKKR